MTLKKYRRLILILALPLLLAGLALAVVVLQPQHYAMIRCENSAVFGQNCQKTDGLGEPWDEQIERRYPAWFDIELVEYDENHFPYTMIAGSQIALVDAQILDVSPYLGTDDTPGSPVAELKAKGARREPIAILFGSGSDHERDLYMELLGCNELNLINAPSFYEAKHCGVPNGIVSVSFSVGPEGQARIAAIRDSADNASNEARTGLVLSYVMLTSSLLISFVFFSAIVWLVVRAAKYVAAA